MSHAGKRGSGWVGILLLVGFGYLSACTGPEVDRGSDAWTEIEVAEAVAGRGTAAVRGVNGELLVAYTSTQEGETNVFLVTLGADGRRGEPVRVNDRAGDAASHLQAPAQVATGPNGEIYVAWIRQTPVEGRRFPASDIRLSRSVDGGRSFSPAVTVNPNPGFPTSHHFHNLAVGKDGAVYVSWLDGTANDRVQAGAAAANEPPGMHGAHQNVDPANGSRPDTAVHHTNSAEDSKPGANIHSAHSAGSSQPGTELHDAHAADGSRPGTELHVARSADGGQTFGPPVVVARGTCQCCRTALATGDSGAVYVAWRHIFEDGGRDVAVARSRDGGRSFSGASRVQADGWTIDGCPHAGPALALDATGRLHVIWYTGVAERSGVYHASSTDGGNTFTGATRLTGESPIAQVAAVASGSDVLLAWERPLMGDFSILRTGRSGLDTLIARHVPGRLPALAASGNRNALVFGRDHALEAVWISASPEDPASPVQAGPSLVGSAEAPL